MPWWAALLLAVGASVVGFAIDAGSGHKELTHIFAGLYIAGCVAAVLAVRQDGVFTAVIQPPLILFCAVPGAYWLFHGRKVGHLKDLLINCGYPLIERFPLMLGTAGGVLLIGLVRWYFGMSHRPNAAASEDGAETANGADVKSFVSGIAAKVQAVLRREPGADDADGATPADKRRARNARRAAEARRAARANRSAGRAHSRHGRPPRDDEQDPLAERPRRSNRRSQTASRDFDPADPPRRPRRPRPEADADPRGQSPREPRREPRQRRSPYERPAPRGNRFDGYDPPGAPEHLNRYEPYERPTRRSAPRGTNGSDPTHHPISQVRYRGGSPLDEPGAERPSRSRTSGRSRGRPPAESWEYDS